MKKPGKDTPTSRIKATFHDPKNPNETEGNWVPLMVWRPIGSAPKDVWVLVWAPGRLVTTAVWSDDSQMWTDGIDEWAFDYKPTHWMELPEPPE